MAVVINIIVKNDHLHRHRVGKHAILALGRVTYFHGFTLSLKQGMHKGIYIL